MLVAVDVGSLIGRPTGVGRFTGLLVDALESVPEPPELRRYVLSARASLPDGVRRLPYPARAALAAWARIDHPRARRTLRGCDVVHGTNFVAPPTGRATVITVHDCSPLTHPERVHRDVRAFVPVLRRAVARGAWVHTPSAYVGAQVAELLGTARVRAIPHGAPDVTAGDPSQRSAVLDAVRGRRYVVAVGSLEPRKNLPRLVAAFGHVAADDPDVCLVLVGPAGPDSDAVADAAAQLGPGRRERVLLAGWVDDREREFLLRHAGVLAYPSLDEGFGLPVLEAFAAGVPVVAADAGSLPEVAGDAALLVPPTDIVALAAALTRALDDGDERRQLLAAGRARLALYDWATTAQSMVGLYRDALADGTARRGGRQ